MKETISEAERSMHELDYLFMAEQHRISDLFGDRHKQFFGPHGPNLKRNSIKIYSL